jgi:hypothetical protein
MCSLVSRYRSTHFAFAKWNAKLETFEKALSEAISASTREAPVDLIAFPVDSEEQFIDHSGHISLSMDDLPWKRFE